MYTLRRLFSDEGFIGVSPSIGESALDEITDDHTRNPNHVSPDRDGEAAIYVALLLFVLILFRRPSARAPVRHWRRVARCGEGDVRLVT